MSEQEKLNQIQELLRQYKKPKTLDWLIDFIKKDIKKREVDAEKYREYYLENKDKRDEYHKRYRLEHPEYEERRRERARLRRHKI